ncbi:MAG: hypothetical protein WBF66_09235 [Dehalococcoidia bacterium]
MVKRAPKRPYALRKPRDYAPVAPGDLIQVDTAEIRPLPGLVYKNFAARDVVSRWDVLEVHSRATAQAAASFLNRVLERMPFPVRAIQVDGGSEFRAQFEEACQKRNIRLFVLPPPCTLPGTISCGPTARSALRPRWLRASSSGLGAWAIWCGLQREKKSRSHVAESSCRSPLSLDNSEVVTE